MTDLLLALGATAASLAVMYLVCLRPMRRTRDHSHAADPTRAELARLRREIARLGDRAAAK